MDKNIPRIFLMIILSVMAGIAIFHPQVFSDKNEFLKAFSSNYFMSVIGVMLSVTLASCMNLHFKLNELEVKIKKKFPLTKKSIRRSAYSLVLLFPFSFLLLLFKSWFGFFEHVQAFSNAGMIAVLFFYASVVFDITATIFTLPAE